MADSGALTLAFLRSRPDAAAEELDAAPAAEVAALFREIPARTVAGVLRAMLPRNAAAVLVVLDVERAAELLAAMDVPAMVAAMRQLPPAHRDRLVAALPTSHAVPARMLLAQPEHTIGAWCDATVLALRASVTAEQALARIRGTDAPQERVIVIDDERRVLGHVCAAALLRAEPARRLATLAEPNPLLPARTPLVTARGHAAWRETSVVTVVEHGDRLLGLLTRDALERADPHARRDVLEPEFRRSLGAVFATTAWQSVEGLLGAAVLALPPVPAVRDARLGD